MRKKVLLTSTLAQAFTLFYRLPSEPNKPANPVIEVSLLPRELVKEVVFPSEEHYNAFMAQNQEYFDTKKLILGSTKGKTAEKVNADNTEREQSAIFGKKNKAVKALEEAGTQGKSSLKVEVSKESE